MLGIGLPDIGLKEPGVPALFRSTNEAGRPVFVAGDPAFHGVAFELLGGMLGTGGVPMNGGRPANEALLFGVPTNDAGVPEAPSPSLSSTLLGLLILIGIEGEVIPGGKQHKHL